MEFVGVGMCTETSSSVRPRTAETQEPKSDDEHSSEMYARTNSETCSLSDPTGGLHVNAACSESDPEGGLHACEPVLETVGLVSEAVARAGLLANPVAGPKEEVASGREAR